METPRVGNALRRSVFLPEAFHFAKLQMYGKGIKQQNVVHVPFLSIHVVSLPGYTGITPLPEDMPLNHGERVQTCDIMLLGFSICVLRIRTSSHIVTM